MLTVSGYVGKENTAIIPRIMSNFIIHAFKVVTMLHNLYYESVTNVKVFNDIPKKKAFLFNQHIYLFFCTRAREAHAHAHTNIVRIHVLRLAYVAKWQRRKQPERPTHYDRRISETYRIAYCDKRIL